MPVVSTHEFNERAASKRHPNPGWGAASCSARAGGHHLENAAPCWFGISDARLLKKCYGLSREAGHPASPPTDGTVVYFPRINADGALNDDTL